MVRVNHHDGSLITWKHFWTVIVSVFIWFIDVWEPTKRHQRRIWVVQVFEKFEERINVMKRLHHQLSCFFGSPLCKVSFWWRAWKGLIASAKGFFFVNVSSYLQLVRSHLLPRNLAQCKGYNPRRYEVSGTQVIYQRNEGFVWSCSFWNRATCEARHFERCKPAYLFSWLWNGVFQIQRPI